MDLGPHAAFIETAYAVAVVVVTALIAWVNDHGIYTKPRRCNRFAISTAHTETDIDRTIEVIESFMARYRNALQ